MKLVKMSLVAAMVMGASAFAIDNVKVSGDAKLFYGTNNMGDGDLFSKGNDVAALTTGAGSYADTALRLGATGDLLKGVSFGVTGYGVSTLGLENNLVSQTWTGAHGVTTGTGSSFAGVVGGAQVDDAAWMGEAWLAATLGKTTVKLGRMELDTPLAFSEKWSIVPNTFEGAVIINQDLPDTTLVGAWVGKGNGGEHTLLSGAAFVGIDGGVVGEKGTFNTFVKDGAYAAAIVNNSFKPLTAQAWYYNVVDIADAFWLQGDVALAGFTIGGQYAELNTKGFAAASDDTEAYALKVGYEGIENLKVSAAYSDVDNGNGLMMANVATLNANSQSKLYTEAAWGGNFGYVGAPGAESWNLKASYEAKEIAKFCASYTNVDNDITGNTHNLDEIALAVSKSFGALDTKLAYISTDADDQNLGSQYNTINAYLTLNF